MDEEFDYEEEKSTPTEPFHIEVDLHETGDYSRLLVVPCDVNFTVISNDEHLCTIVHTCKEVECWEQEEGNLDEGTVEKIGLAIEAYTSSY